MASYFARLLGKVLPQKLTDDLKKRTVSKSEARHKQILRHISQSDSVLDVGCVKHSLEDLDWRDPKPGEWLHAEIRQNAGSVLGIDLVEEEVAKMSAEGFNVEVANAESFQLEDEFDIIVAGELIEHLSNPGKFLSNCYEHLSEDGIVIITTPNPRRLQHLYWYLSGNESRINTEHTMWFDNQVFGELVSRHNFRIRQFHYYSPSVSLVSRPLFNLGLFQPLTAGGFTFVLEPE